MWEACECVYDQKRQKPGLKAGAIESINQRLGLYYGRNLYSRIEVSDLSRIT